MPDVSALAALVIAIVALFVAVFQLTQQILATAYVIRKCDQLVTGGLTKGAKRQWHWRQFRFTVKYRSIVFALPQSIYTSLGVGSTIQVGEPSKEIWDNAGRTRSQRTSAQACWVDFLQDVAMSCCLRPEDICTREESGDRIPDDLTVAPTRVDTMTILLSSVAMGMQISKYSPTTGEITLGGGVGGISSSNHPILGCLLHYSVFANEPTTGLEAARRHGRALRQKEGVWANAVFGRFRDRSYRPEMVPFDWLQSIKIPILQQSGWPEADDGTKINSDTIGGAACFMAFGHVDAYEVAPPSVILRWTAHFAEIIVKAHHVEISNSREKTGSQPRARFMLHNASAFMDMLEKYGCTSPHLSAGTVMFSEYLHEQMKSGTSKASIMLLDNDLFDSDLREDNSDPSSYLPPTTLWSIVCLADNYMRQIRLNLPSQIRLYIPLWADRIIAKAICPLRSVGPPSWGRASGVVKDWPNTFATNCTEILNELEGQGLFADADAFWIRNAVRLFAEFSMLRSAYYTVMMRAAHPLGPGLDEDSRIETALAYMA